MNIRSLLAGIFLAIFCSGYLAAQTIAGDSVGAPGLPGTIYSGYVFIGGDDFTGPLSINCPNNPAGRYFTQRLYSIFGQTLDGPRGAYAGTSYTGLQGYDIDTCHTGYGARDVASAYTGFAPVVIYKLVVYPWCLTQQEIGQIKNWGVNNYGA